MAMRLDISIGPVQDFVSQSRRTVDLWGSSYLLSFLSAHAMHGAEMAGGKIVRPLVADDHLYRWVKGFRVGGSPQIGTLPNHFVVEVHTDAGAVADRATEAFDTAWSRVHEAVWCRFLTPVESLGPDTRRIWDRQVNNFWRIAWTADPSGDGYRGLLARRKHWRIHRPTVEPGDKCTIMHDMQELSGYTRSDSRRSREGQDRFWSDLGMHLGTLDLRPNERLCAVAFVKRMFPRASRDALGWKVDQSRWPSTVYVAAVPWIDRVAATAPEEAQSYAEKVRHVAGDIFSEQYPGTTRWKGIRSFARLDGNWFHSESVGNDARCPLSKGGIEVRKELAESLEEIAEMDDDEGRRIGTPSHYYGLLLADGDRLGELVSKHGAGPVGKALASFTGDIGTIVEYHHGVTVYAGGDDVMALLPLPKALSCAAKLSRHYGRAFWTDGGMEIEATLSAAVVIAQIRYPFGGVMREARRLLEDVAKDGNGRNSLAVGVLKPGGLHCQWATTWTRSGRNGRVCARKILDDLVDQLREVTSEPGLSSGLVYRTRKTLTMLCGWERWEPGMWGHVLHDLDLRAFLRAEIARSFTDHPGGAGTGANERVDEISDLVCHLLMQSKAGSLKAEAMQVGIDALLLARFMADGGDGEAT